MKEILKTNEAKNLLRNIIIPELLVTPPEPDSADCPSYCQSTLALEGERAL